MAKEVLIVASDALERPRFSAEERYRALSEMLDAISTAVDTSDVLQRIVSLVRDELTGDRGWLVPGPEFEISGDGFVTPESWKALFARALESPAPVAAREGDVDLLVEILKPREGEPWALVVQRRATGSEWTKDETDVFADIGRCATLALNHALIHERALQSVAKVNAILDQIPEAAAIYDHTGHLERLNAPARRTTSLVFGPDPEGRIRAGGHRYLDGRPLAPNELPSMLALRGETIKADYLVHDARTGEPSVVNLRAAPIRDDADRIIGSVVLARDVTEERQTNERESWRRRRAECLANLGLEAVTVQPTFDNLDDTARRVAESVGGIVRIYLYHSATGQLDLVGFSAASAKAEEFRTYFAEHPYKPGEGLAGAVFQIGRPLFFFEIRGDAVIDFSRDEEERAVKRELNEQSLIACPIESYGDRIGALLISRSDAGRTFDAEDVEFAQSIAERIGAASHIHRLTRISAEGHRAAEELARREVDARVRFEAVLETAPVGIAVISADELRFELVNVRWFDFATTFGKISPDTKLVGLRVGEVIPDLEQLLKQVAETGETRVDEALDLSTGGEPLYVNRIVSAVRGRFSGITQSITILIQDVTEQVLEDRQNREREAWRRRRAECLANIGVEAVTVQPSFEDLDEPATRVAQAVGGTAMIYLYHQPTSELHTVGFASVAPTAAHFLRLREHTREFPYHPGEGLPGTVFQIGRPLLFSDVRGNAVIDFGRDEQEKKIIADMAEQSLIACPIESYGDRIGALVISRSDSRRDFDAEDLEFAQAVAERIGAGSHIHRLTRMSLEGHRAAEELARREVDARVRFETVLETAPIGVAVVSADELRFELANVRWMEFASRFGRIPPDEKVIGLRVAEVIPGFEQTLKQVAESGENRIDEAFEIAGKPSPIYVNRVISAVRGRFSGITQSITVLVQDVTEQVKAKREIEALAQMMAERSARLDSILGSMTDGLWVYDAEGSVIDVNQAALTMFGLGSRTEAIAHGWFESFRMRYPDGRPVPKDDIPQARALRGSTVPDYLAIGRHLITGKDVDLSIAAAPIESNGIVGAVLVIRDITALQELDRKKDEFLSVASHELRTPLTTIKGYTQLLAQTVNDLPGEERSTYLNAVLGEIDRMMGLISELLDVSRIETNRLQIHPQPIRWLEFVERRASAFRVQNPTRIIRFDGKMEETTVHVDPDRMRQVVDNLLSNAMKYSPDGTDIDVVTTIEDGYMVTSVIDHGIGIPRDEISQLFDRFHRARNVSSRYYGGLGLGLYIARAIIEAHKGAISVESEEGKGANFTIRVPLP